MISRTCNMEGSLTDFLGRHCLQEEEEEEEEV